MKPVYENERLKRQYRNYLLESQGRTESTVLGIERALSRYEELFGGEDFSRFNQKRAVEFKKHLESLTWDSKKLSGSTTYHTLRSLRQFLFWLAGQSGYKKKISLDAISYLTLGSHRTCEVLTPKEQSSPSLEYVLRLVDSIPLDSEIAKRDRALIAFLLLSGMRYAAVTSLPLGCFDPDTLSVHQDPRRGVNTKFRKAIVTKLMVFDQRLVGPILDWHKYLIAERLFPHTAPFFPKSRVEQAAGALSYVCTGVSDQFWQGGNGLREILQKRAEDAGLDYFHPHSFRHAAVLLAMQKCTTPEEFKAVSQNLGHSHVMTTLQTYGNLPIDRMREVMGQINFGASSSAGQKKLDLKKLTEAMKEAGIVVDDSTI